MTPVEQLNTLHHDGPHKVAYLYLEIAALANDWQTHHIENGSQEELNHASDVPES
jgi:hypothetical protein